MDFQSFIDATEDWHRPIIDPKFFGSLASMTPISSREYLNFSEADLLLATGHGCVNALSNAKRAIDCQITNILDVLGLSKSGNIHRKIERIEKVGIIAPRILKKINRIRNLLEHEFYKPTIDEAEDAVDIATLFVESSDKVFVNFMGSFWLAKGGSENRPEFHRGENNVLSVDENTIKSTFAEGMHFNYDEKSKDYTFTCVSNSQDAGYFEVKRASPLHLELIRCSVLNQSNVHEYDEELAGTSLLKAIREVWKTSL